MTDNEIIKALECCIGDTDGKDCFGCPLYEIDDCQAHLNLAALDLINHLQAKLDEAEDTIQFAYKELKKAEAEVKTELDKFNAEKNDVMYHKAQIKAEAYKEFAERVSKLICDNTYPDFDKDGKAVNIWSAKDGYKQIDNLVKEVAGDNDE